MRKFALIFAASLVLCSNLSLPICAAVDPFDADVARRLQSIQQLETQSDKRADLADAFWDLAAKYMTAGRYATAEQYLRKSYEVEKTLKRPKRMIVTGSLNPLVDVCTTIGTALLMQGKLDEAIKQYDEASRLASAAGAGSESAAIQNNIANGFLQANRLDESRAAALKGLESAANEPTVKSKLLRTLAIIFLRTKELPQALKYAKESYDEAAKVDDAASGTALVFVGEVQNRLGQCDESMRTYEGVIAKYDKQIFPDVLAAAEIALAKNYYERLLIPASIKHYKNAVAFASEDQESKDLLIDCLISLGMACSDVEQFAEAENYHKQAVDLARKQGNTAREIEALMQLSEDYIVRGNAERALTVLNDCSTKLEGANLNSKYKADLSTSYAKCYKALGQRDPAIKMAQDSIRMYHETHNPLLEALSYTTLATIYLDFGFPDKIEELYEQSKALYVGLPARDAARFDYNLAQSKLMQKKPLEAIPIYEGAVAKVQFSGDTGLLSALYRGIGLANYYKGDFAASLASYEKALQLSKDSGSLDTQWSCNLGVAKALKGLQRYDEAEGFLTKAIALVEQERSAMTRDNFKTHSMDFRKNCFEEVVDLYGLTNRPYEALAMSERGKARAFLDLLANRSQRQVSSAATAKPAGSPVLVAMAAPGASGTRGLQITGKAPTVDDTIEESAISDVNAQPPSVAEIKELVAKRQSTCIEYMVQNDKLFTWVISPNGDIKMPKPGATDLRQLVSQLMNVINERPGSPEEVARTGKLRQQLLRKIYDALIKPIEASLPTDKDAVITIIPHDYLFRIPFAALQAADGSYLIEKHTLSYTPAIGVLRATQKLGEETAGKESRLLAFGNPITKDNAFLGALPYAEKEVKHIANIYGPAKSVVEVGAAATKQRLGELVSQASDLHLATHGLVDEERPMRSCVILAPTASDTGELSVKDILLMKNLKTKIVVLSACQTGRGKITGDGVVGLSRAFIIAGTPSVLVSQWNVDDIMTEFQMTKFYGQYLHGKDKARALRDAQIATIRYMENTPDEEPTVFDPMKIRANPRLWAAFQLIGETR